MRNWLKDAIWICVAEFTKALSRVGLIGTIEQPEYCGVPIGLNRVLWPDGTVTVEDPETMEPAVCA